MTYSRDTTPISVITSQPVSTWSEAWQHECGARGVPATSKTEWDAFFKGVTGQDGKKRERGIIGIRRADAARQT
jgi:hypothetical protein